MTLRPGDGESAAGFPAVNFFGIAAKKPERLLPEGRLRNCWAAEP